MAYTIKLVAKIVTCFRPECPLLLSPLAGIDNTIHVPQLVRCCEVRGVRFYRNMCFSSAQIVDAGRGEYCAAESSYQNKEKRTQATAPFDGTYASYTFRGVCQMALVCGVSKFPHPYVHHGFVDVRKANGV